MRGLIRVRSTAAVVVLQIVCQVRGMRLKERYSALIERRLAALAAVLEASLEAIEELGLSAPGALDSSESK